MSKKVHRHLLEMQWRNGGELDLLVCQTTLQPFLTSELTHFERWRGFTK